MSEDDTNPPKGGVRINPVVLTGRDISGRPAGRSTQDPEPAKKVKNPFGFQELGPDKKVEEVHKPPSHFEGTPWLSPPVTPAKAISSSGSSNKKKAERPKVRFWD